MKNPLNRRLIGMTAEYVALSLFLTGCFGKSKSQNSNASGGVATLISMSNQSNWTTFGNASIQSATNGFILTNGTGDETFASAGFLFPTPLNNSVPYELTLKVRGVNGAKNLGLTAVETDENPNDVDYLQFSKIVNISDGQDHLLTYLLPQDSEGITQIALHIGATFGSATLGNPTGAGVLVEEAFVGPPGAQPSTTGSAQEVSQQSISTPLMSPVQVVDPKTLTQISGSVVSSKTPADYVPIANLAADYRPGMPQPGTNISDVHPVTIIPVKK